MNHGGVDLDPLVGLDDERMPLRSRLLKLPNLRAKYLEHVHEIADKSLDWEHLGPIVAQQRALVEAAIQADTRKLATTEAFLEATAPEVSHSESATAGPPLRATSLRDFADQRREYLLRYEEPAAPSHRGGG
jgi:hypothetical protein